MIEFSASDIENIERLVKEKYETWDWNFGFSPNYNFKKAIKIPAGFIELHLDVHKGYIENVKIFGDFFASSSINELENLLIGKKHELEEIVVLLESIDLTSYFGKVDASEIITLFK
jgi:lipoate-protein ligase A